MAINQLVESGHEVVALGKHSGVVNGVQIETTQKKFINIDTVTLYLDKANQQTYYQYIVDLKPKRVIFNPGAENKEFETFLDRHQIYHSKACTLVLLSINEY